MRIRELLSTTAWILALCALLVGCASSHARAPRRPTATLTRCAPAQLRLRAGKAQGTATMAVVFATVIDRGPPCVLSGSMRMIIEHDGKPARVEGNPAAFVLAGRRAGRSVVVMPSFWWGNWCGGLRGFTGVVRYDGLVQRFRWPVLPDCISRGKGSSVAAEW